MLVNNYPMTVVGVSAAGFAGLDPTRSPQIRVPILMQPILAPEWTWLKMEDERTRWVQVFGRLKPGYTIESAAAPMQTLFTQIREYETTLPGAKDFTPYIREQFMKGTLHPRQGRRRLLADPQRLLGGAHRADVHGRPGAAHRLRQRRQPADCPRLHAPARDRRPAVARRHPAAAGASAPHREPAAGRCRRRAGHRPGVRHDPRPAGVRADRRRTAAAAAVARRPHPHLHRRAHRAHRHRVRAAAGAAGQPSRHLEHAQGHGRRGGRQRRVAVPPQGAGGGAGGAQLPAAVRRRALRAEPAEPEAHRHRRGARQPGDVPAVAGPEWLRRGAHRPVPRSAPGSPGRRAGGHLRRRRRVCRS